MQNHARKITPLTLLAAFALDANSGTGEATQDFFVVRGRHFPAVPLHWPADDAADAELRRAIAYRHCVVFANNTYLVTAEGAADFARCEQTRSFCRATIEACARGKRLSKTERANVTLMVAKSIATAAEKILGATHGVTLATRLLNDAGAEARLPSTAPVAPQNTKASDVGAAAVTIIQEACNAVDSAQAAIEAAAQAPVSALKGSHLRLVK